MKFSENFFRSFLSDIRCEKCQSPCSACSNLTSCLTCINKLYLFNDRCVEKCPDGYYAQNNECLQCNPMCGTCIGPSEDDCKSCADGFILDEKLKKCFSLCPDGNYYDKNDKSCKLCEDNCLECLYPGSYCRQCLYPMSLDTSKHRCFTCCTTNITTDDCCQCPSIWDGKKMKVFLQLIDIFLKVFVYIHWYLLQFIHQLGG